MDAVAAAAAASGGAAVLQRTVFVKMEAEDERRLLVVILEVPGTRKPRAAGLPMKQHAKATVVVTILIAHLPSTCVREEDGVMRQEPVWERKKCNIYVIICYMFH